MKDDLSQQISLVSGQFLQAVADLARRHAEATFSAFGAGADRGGSAARPSASGPSSDSSGGRMVRRRPEDLERARRRFAMFVRDNPDLRIKQINRALGTTTAELALPIRQLIASGAIAFEGWKRSTTYHAGRNFAKVFLGSSPKASISSGAPGVEPAGGGAKGESPRSSKSSLGGSKKKPIRPRRRGARSKAHRAKKSGSARPPKAPSRARPSRAPASS